MPIRILIADDNIVVRTQIRQLLSGTNREIIEAEDGAQAVEKAVELRPDLVILDLAMPVMDGFAAARHMAKQIPEIPILMCTMHFSPHLQVEVQKFGVRKVISKTDSGTLVAAVEELLNSLPPPAVAVPPPALLPSDPLPVQASAEPMLTPPDEASLPSTEPLQTDSESPKDPE